MIDKDVPFPVRDALERQLARDEVVVWLEQPDPAQFKIISGWIGILFGVPTMGYALYVIIGVAMGKLQQFAGEDVTPGLAVLYSLPLIVVACVGLGAPLLYRHAARNTAYAITNQRVLIVRISMFGVVDVQAVPGRSLNLRATYTDGVGGHIDLVADVSVNDDLREDVNCLVAVRDVRATEAALRNLIQSSSKSSL